MADAERTLHPLIGQSCLKLTHLALLFAKGDAVVHDRDTGGVVTSIFQPIQAIENYFLGFFGPNIPDYATHNIVMFKLEK
jgi:hypothetical protein